MTFSDFVSFIYKMSNLTLTNSTIQFKYSNANEAAEAGDLEELKRMFAAGFELFGVLDNSPNFNRTRQIFNVCHTAAAKGHLNCLRWAHENGCTIGNSYSAAKNGHLDCLRYCIENTNIRDLLTTAYAAENGHLDCLRFAFENGCRLNLLTMAWAAANGHLDCMKFTHENGYRLNSDNDVFCQLNTTLPTVHAAKNGHLNCLQYAHEVCGFPLEDNVCNSIQSAASNGYLDCLRYAHEKGCGWGKTTTLVAAYNGHLDCLRFAHENGCLWHEDTIDDTICIENYKDGKRWDEKLDCIRYAIENGCSFDDENEEIKELVFKIKQIRRWTIKVLKKTLSDNVVKHVVAEFI